MFSYYEIALPVWVCRSLLWSSVSSMWTKRELILYMKPLFLNNTKNFTDWIFNSCADALTVNSTIFHCHKFRDPKTASLIDNVFTFRVRVNFGGSNRRHCELENAVEHLRSMPTGMTNPDTYRCWTSAISTALPPTLNNMLLWHARAHTHTLTHTHTHSHSHIHTHTHTHTVTTFRLHFWVI